MASNSGYEVLLEGKTGTWAAGQFLSLAVDASGVITDFRGFKTGQALTDLGYEEMLSLIHI